MEQLLEILRGVNPSPDYENCNTLIDDGLLDSFDIITLVSELTEAYDIEIGAEEIVPENFNSAQNLLEMITRLENE
jgi:acyl carrier protein